MVRGISFATFRKTHNSLALKGLKPGTLDLHGKCDWNGRLSMVQHGLQWYCMVNFISLKK